MLFRRATAFLLFLFFAACGTRPEAMDEPDGYLYWNPDRQMKLSFSDIRDTNGISAVLSQGTNKIVLYCKWKFKNETNADLFLALPENSALVPGADHCALKIEMTNSGKTRVLTNQAVILDATAPQTKLIAFSPVIARGGAAMVVIRATDAHMKYPRIYEHEAGNFFTEPYRRDGYYIGMMSWPVTQYDFSPVVITEDRAGNAVTDAIPITAKRVKYPVNNIPVDNEFKNDKLDEVGSSNTNAAIGEKERYDLIMQGFQKKKDVSVADLTSVRVRERVETVQLKSFNPLLSARVTSPYGEHRNFLLRGSVVRDSYHFGVDMASVSNAAIFASSPGTVVYQGYNGANGNLLLVHHGLGIYSLYAHCSRIFVRKYDRVGPGQLIAITGTTGYSLGDHLHFGIIIQGRSSNPMEWMDADWLKKNILDVVRTAGAQIDPAGE